MNADTAIKGRTLHIIYDDPIKVWLDMRPAALFHNMDFHEFVLSSLLTLHGF